MDLLDSSSVKNPREIGVKSVGSHYKNILETWKKKIYLMKLTSVSLLLL